MEFYLRIYSGVILAREALTTGKKTCSIATLSTTNSTWTDLGLNQGLFGFRLVTNHLLHFLDVLLTVHLSIILATDQLNAQILVL